MQIYKDLDQVVSTDKENIPPVDSPVTRRPRRSAETRTPLRELRERTDVRDVKDNTKSIPDTKDKLRATTSYVTFTSQLVQSPDRENMYELKSHLKMKPMGVPVKSSGRSALAPKKKMILMR